MLSKGRISEITSLHHKKYRHEKNKFIVEGIKAVDELLHSGWKIDSIYATDEYLMRKSLSELSEQTEVIVITQRELEKISALTTPNQVLAVAGIPGRKELKLKPGLIIILEDIKDPGNLGTLIRMADWFGIDKIICSPTSADCYNPKVVQASMGSLFRVAIDYHDLAAYFENNKNGINLPVFATLLNGKSIYEEELSKHGLLVFGNESIGISGETMKYVTKSLCIPAYKDRKAESLNVSIAAGIVCAEFRRRG